MKQKTWDKNDSEEAIKLLNQGWSNKKIALKLNRTERAMESFFSKRNVTRKFVASKIYGESEDEKTKRLLLKFVKSKQKLNLIGLANKIDRSPETIERLLDEMSLTGLMIQYDTEEVEILKTPKPAEPTRIDTRSFFGDKIRFGAIGDNHLCSSYERMDILNAMYDIFEKEGITTVYQAGNMIEGESHFNKFDIKVRGVDNQCQYFVDHWPKRKGITTYFITGDDHEGWYIQREQVDVGKIIINKAKEVGRDDLVYLGNMEADIILGADKGHSRMRLIHAGGGSTYATSYTAQKIVECVPLDSEILTKQGWKKYDELRVGDEVMGYDIKKDKCEWTLLKAINVYKNQLVNTYKNDLFEITCTPNHKWVIDNPKTRDRKEWKRSISTIDEHPWDARIKQSALSIDGDGLEILNGQKLLDKKRATELVLQMTSGERRAFIVGLLYGEGTLQKRNYESHKKTVIFSQIEGDVNDAFRLACFLEGIATSCKKVKKREEHHKQCMRSTLLIKSHRRINSFKKINTYKTDVWCPTTGLNTWVMKQGNVITITGNSYQGGEKPRILLIGHYHKLEYGYPREVHCVQVGCTQDQTPFMRKKKIHAHLGGVIIECNQAVTGEINRFKIEFLTFFDKKFYEDKKFKT